MEAYESMLETWMELVNKMKDICLDSLKPRAVEVFNTYIQCHISAPEGTRTQVCNITYHIGVLEGTRTREINTGYICSFKLIQTCILS
jgi:hypothetical protein